MSHQTGAQLTAFPLQTTELTKPFRHAKPDQIMKAHVPEFHACKCQENGTKERINPKRENIGNRGKDGSKDAFMVG
jgi:hypothetical protein